MTESERINAKLWTWPDGQPVEQPKPDPAKPLYEEITRLRTALAASEAKLEKARDDALEEAEERLMLMVRYHRKETDRLEKLRQENLKDAVRAHMHGAQAARTDGCREAAAAIRALKFKDITEP